MALDFARIVAGWKRFLALWAALAVGCGMVLAGIGIYQRRDLYGGDAKALIGLRLSAEMQKAAEQAGDGINGQTNRYAEIAGISRIQSPTIVARAMDHLGLGISQLDKIRSGITIQDVLSDESNEDILIYRTLLSKNSLSLEAAQQAAGFSVSAAKFIVSLNYRKTNLSRTDAVQLLDEIIRCYRDSFEAENNGLFLPEEISADVPAGIAERIDFYREQLGQIQAWLQERVYIEATGQPWETLRESFNGWQDKHGGLLTGLFRSGTTGFTMADLLDKTEMLRTDLLSAEAYVSMAPVFSGSLQEEQNRLLAQKDELFRTQKLLQSRYSALENTVKNYEREVSVHYLAVEGAHSSGAETSDAYDALILEMTDLQAQTADVSAALRENQKKLSRLETAESASPSQQEEAEGLLDALEERISALRDQLIVTAEEYQQEAVHPNTVEILVPAGASGNGLISSQWKRRILILEAVLLIAWLGIGVGYGLKESVLNEKKDRLAEAGNET